MKDMQELIDKLTFGEICELRWKIGNRLFAILTYCVSRGELTRKEFTVLEGRLIRNLTYQELGKEMGVTRERVRQIEEKAIPRMANLKI